MTPDQQTKRLEAVKCAKEILNSNIPLWAEIENMSQVFLAEIELREKAEADSNFWSSQNAYKQEKIYAAHAKIASLEKDKQVAVEIKNSK